MEECSTGALVPAVKAEPFLSSFGGSVDPCSSDIGRLTEEKGMSEVDKDLLCPICMQIVKDAFLTACGHSFCYMCIITHLSNKSDCPCCAQSLCKNQLFPNFLLDKVAYQFHTLYLWISLLELRCLMLYHICCSFWRRLRLNKFQKVHPLWSIFVRHCSRWIWLSESCNHYINCGFCCILIAVFCFDRAVKYPSRSSTPYWHSLQRRRGKWNKKKPREICKYCSTSWIA